MKVAHVISTIGPGGAETYVKALAIELKRLGVEQEVWSLTSTDRVYSGDPMAAQFERDYRRELSESGIAAFCLGIEDKTNLVSGISRLREAMERSRPDAVHVHVYWGLLYGIGLMTDVPYLFTHHGGRLRLVALHRAQFRRALRKYIAICRSDRELLMSRIGLADERVDLIPNGIDVSRFSVPGRERDQMKPLRAIAVGRLCEQKNYPMMLRAFRRVVDETVERELPVPTLRIVGDGPDRNALEKLIAQLDLAGNVNLLGLRNDVPHLLAESDVFLMSSSWEGMPIVLIEALASGLPVVATAVDGNRDVIEDGKSGLLVEPGADGAMAEAVLRIADEKLWKKLARGAVKRAAIFSVESAAEQHMRVYSQMQGVTP